MKNLLNFVVTQIVDEPKAVKIAEEKDENGIIKLTLEVAEEDMGKVIGKKGKIIFALRQLLRIKALKTNQRVFLELKER